MHIIQCMMISHGGFYHTCWSQPYSEPPRFGLDQGRSVSPTLQLSLISLTLMVLPLALHVAYVKSDAMMQNV